ncbi:hypothetical protein BH24ACI2_BH24ACI2_05860 [soil metagenome]
MTNEEIIRKYATLPPEARREVEDFVAFLRQRYGKKDEKMINGNLSEENFVGIWKDREDLQDSSAWVRGIRQTEWTK